jgi:diguanylate cyclase (GGDEF)-like protein
MFLKNHLPLWVPPVIAASVILAVHFIFITLFPGQTGLVTDIYTPLMGLAAMSAMAYASYRARSASRVLAQVWGLLAVGQTFTLAGDITWLVYSQILVVPPSPSLADLFYLLCYPFFLAGLLSIPVRSSSGTDAVKRAIDSLILFLVGLLILWNLALGPAMQRSNDDQLFKLITLAYPTGDLMLLGALLVSIYRAGPAVHGAPLVLLAAGMLSAIAFNTIYAYQNALGAFQAGSPVNLLYTLSAALFSAGAMARVRYQRVFPDGKPEPSGGQRPFESMLMYMPYAWVLGAFVLLNLLNLDAIPTMRNQVNLIVGGIVCLVLLRQYLVLRDNRALSLDLADALEQVRRQAAALEHANAEMQVEIRERRRAEEKLTYDNLHDALTGLPNRTLFLDRLHQAAQKKKRFSGFGYAVLFLDLDSFKVVNDSLGHITGDQLLVRAAEVLRGCVRGIDTVARLGGDEFVVLLEDIAGRDAAVATAERIQLALSQPMDLQDTQVVISVSIGIVENVLDEARPEDVLRDADLAMYQAKSCGKARYAIFEDSMRASIMHRMALESDLRRAMECHEFSLHYQPILSLPDHHLVGFEALARWNHPARGLVMPMEFIPVAEETGMIVPLGKWILYEACRQARVWQGRYPEMPNLRVSVNISGRQLKQPDFVQHVIQALQSSGLAPNRLMLEVTESVFIENLDMVAGALDTLRSLGVETQIDDFGKGYSSLGYLQRLPVRSIKIDRSFIQSISGPAGVADDRSMLTIPPSEDLWSASSTPDARISTPDFVRAIFSLVRELGIQAVAEGVETEFQLDEISRMHCPFAQGYLLAMPMDCETMEMWLQEQNQMASLAIH